MIKNLHLKSWLLLLCMIVGAGTAWADTEVLSWSRSTTNIYTSGYTFEATASAKTGYYQDGSGTSGIKLYSTSNPISSTPPTSVTFTASVGGGSGDKDLSSPVYVCYVDANGKVIDNTETEVTSHITTNTGDTYNISMPTTSATSAYGIYIYHEKESGYNVRYYSFSLSYSGGSTPTMFTVTYDANGGTGTMTDDNSPYEANSEVTLLANTFTAPSDMIWDSWEVKDAADNNIAVTNGKFTMPASNVTVKAQWVTDPNAPQYNWVLTDFADLTSSDIFVIVGDNGSTYAMRNDGGASSPLVSEVTIANNMISSTVTDNIKWNVSGDANNGYTFNPNGATTTLYCLDNNSGLRVGIGSGTYSDLFFMDTSGYLITTVNKNTRYIGIYNSQDWRSYTSINNNIKDQTFAFYKRVDASAPQTPSITISNNNELTYDATSGSFNFNVNNSVTGGVTSVSEDVDWISDAAISENSVTFKTTANEATTSRSGVITITYTYGDDETVTKDVTIIQAAAPFTYTTIPDIFEAAKSTSQDVNVTFGNWVVSGVSGSNVFVTDNIGNGFIIYTSDHGFKVKDKLSGTVTGTPLKLYKGSAEFTNLTSTTTGLSVSNDGEITVNTNKTIADLSGVNTGAVVKLSNLTYDGTNLSDGTNTIKPYNTLYSSMSFENGKSYNVIGVYQQFDTTKEILPRSAEDIEEVAITSISADNVNIAANDTGGSISYTINNEVSGGVLTAATEDGSWLTVGEVSRTAVAFTTTQNETGMDRTASVVLTYTYGENNVTKSVTVTQAGNPNNPFTVTAALEVIDALENNGKTENAYITGTIIRIDEVAVYDETADKGYGNATYFISDGTKELEVFRGFYLDNAKFTAEDQIQVGDKVVVYGQLQKYVKGETVTPEIAQGNYIISKESPIVIDENVTNNNVSTLINKNAIIKRTFGKDYWNTFMMPFNGVTMANMKSIFGDDVQIKATGLNYSDKTLVNAGGSTISFSDYTDSRISNSMNYLYLIKPSKDVTNPVFINVEMATVTGTYSSEDQTLKITYSLNKKAMTADEGFTAYYLSTAGTIKKAASEATIKGTRFYFQTKDGVEAKIFIDGEATSIEAIDNGEQASGKTEIYNLAGQKVNKAQKGIYIVNGKKVVIR